MPADLDYGWMAPITVVNIGTGTVFCVSDYVDMWHR
jgi:hypothetical protein